MVSQSILSLKGSTTMATVGQVPSKAQHTRAMMS